MRLHLHQYGDPAAAPLICLHGLTGHGARFGRLAALVGGRVLAPDLRGHGRSGQDPPWTVEQHVADVLETFPGGPGDLLGFSFGALVAATLAATVPVRRLILLDPAIAVPPGLAAERAAQALQTVTYGSHDEAVDALLSGGTLFSTPRELLEEEVREHLVERPDGRLQERYSKPMEVTSWSEMARPAPPVAEVPTLLVTGERSWIPVAHDRWRHAHHVTVAGGHSVLWDDLEPVAQAIAGFLH